MLPDHRGIPIKRAGTCGKVSARWLDMSPCKRRRRGENLAQPWCRVALSMVTCTGHGIRRCKVIFCGVLTSLGKRSHESIKSHTLPLEWKGRVGTQGEAWEGRGHAGFSAHTSWRGVKTRTSLVFSRHVDGLVASSIWRQYWSCIIIELF